jgi:hypothetical protein
MEKGKSKRDQRSLALWAADCAERVLPYFETEYPKDDRPRKAIEEARTWARSGLPMRMSVIRTASLAAHAAAREAKENDAACFAARAAGQAVATAHVLQHAYGPSYYALKAVAAADPVHAEVRIAEEYDWQSRRLPNNLRKGWQDWQSRRLPKGLRLIMERIKARKRKAIVAYPKNKAHFLRLIRFGKEIISICKDLGRTPVLYGSMAHFLHTGDKGMNVNDLDFLVPRRTISNVAKELKRRRIKFTPFPKWDGLVITRGSLKIELDAMDSTYKDTVWHKKLPKDFMDLSIDDVKLKMISLKSMKQLYKIAYARSKDDKAKIKQKIKRLEASLRK